MQLEFRHGDTVVRVDGEVVEIFGAVGFSHRYLLPSLRVEVQPSSKFVAFCYRHLPSPNRKEITSQITGPRSAFGTSAAR